MKQTGHATEGLGGVVIDVERARDPAQEQLVAEVPVEIVDERMAILERAQRARAPEQLTR